MGDLTDEERNRRALFMPIDTDSKFIQALKTGLSFAAGFLFSIVGLALACFSVWWTTSWVYNVVLSYGVTNLFAATVTGFLIMLVLFFLIGVMVELDGS